MGHFGSEDWADFVRGVTSEGQTMAMRRHLDQQCKPCRKILETWRFVSDLGNREASYDPPSDVVRYVKACHTVKRHAEVGWQRRNLARLLFDTIRQPQPAGIRGGALSARQLLFKSGRFLIDLRVDSQFKSNRVSVVGQVLDSARRGEAVQQIPVVLWAEESKVAETASNRLGEFQLEFEVTENLVLAVGNNNATLIPLAVLKRQVAREQSESKGNSG